MDLRKLRNKEQKALKQAVLSAALKSHSKAIRENFPWQLLAKLVTDLPDDCSEDKKLFSQVIASKDVVALLRLPDEIDLQKYESRPGVYSLVYQCTSFLKKYPFGKIATLDPLAKAKARFYSAEEQCRRTNRRLRWYRGTRATRMNKNHPELYSILHTARQNIARWLGPSDPIEIADQIFGGARHGPGGCIGAVGDATTKFFKYAAPTYTVSQRALPYAEAAILSDPQWRRYVVSPSSIVGDPCPSPEESRQAVLSRLKANNYNKVTFVPKTAQTHRAIAIEPMMNVFLQLGVGDYVARQLARVGVNLKSQFRNQELARLGSLDHDPMMCPVTLDMSMASDTLAIELVRELLPYQWFDMLDALRSPSGLLDGALIPYQKFSSMGNGFTFPLETLIFKGLADSVARHLGYPCDSVAVYGDDIICPRGMALELIRVFAFTGFRINTDKSYFFGPFRESCGSDWLEGRNVRPFFLKRKVKNARDLIFVHNSFRDRIRLHGDYDMAGAYGELVSHCRHRLPTLVKEHLLGPEVQNLEGHVFVTWDEAQRSRLVLWNRDVQTWSYATLVDQTVSYSADRIDPQTMSGALFLQFRPTQAEDVVKSYHGTWLTGDALPVNHPSVWGKFQALGPRYPSSKSDITWRDRTKCAVKTQTSVGWRNLAV